MKKKSTNGWVGLLVGGLAVAAVLQEMRRPARDRVWHGHVAGIVPYDFRPPSVDRLRRAWWNPNDQRLLTGTPFGIGWSVNLAQVLGR